MGEFHPAESKVVVQFCPSDLNLTPVQESKLKKLAGPRYNPETEVIKMSCESFDHQAQNKRYLLDLVNKLIAAGKVRGIRRNRKLRLRGSKSAKRAGMTIGPYGYV